jgi:RHS repeat-associated protein
VPDFKFNAKELDEENGMYYFEHRYHAPPTFISRDKYFSKMPFMSPYAYCANNPVGLVDLTGDSVILRGPNVAEALAQMQSASQNIAMTLGDNGTVLASVNDGTKLSKKEQYMLSILNSSSTTTEITAQASGQVAQNISMEGDVGGAFMGTELSTDGNSATSHNVVNVHQTAANDRRVGASGNFIWHEIAEGYRAAQLSVKRQTSASMALMQGDIFGNRFSVGNDKIYQKAHQRAGRYWGGRVIPVAYTGHCYQANIVEQDKWSQYIHPHKSKYEFKKVPCINHYEIGN